MRGVQQFLFPEFDDLNIKIKDVDYVDISTISADLCDERRKHKYEILPKNQFIIFKTGGINRWRPKLGNVFPYIKNMETGNVLGAGIHKTYVRIAINHQGISSDLKLHRIAAEAFIVNDNVEKNLVVDHINDDRLDYRVENLRWTTYSDNNKGPRRKRDGTSYEERLYLGTQKL